MARAAVEEGVLRGCPVCGTKVKDADLKLRDFRWVNEALPGHVGGMDIDFVLSQAKTGRVLHIEMKPPGVGISLGARMTYKVYVKAGFNAWAVWGPDKAGNVQRGHFDARGDIVGITEMTVDELAEEISAWWAAGES